MDKNCKGCEDRKKNCTESSCCKLKLDADKRIARCVGHWSEDKLFYMRRYAGIFANGMKNKWENRVYVDLFSGPGRSRVRPDGRFVDGSPLAALQLPFTHYYFCDLAADCTAALQDRIRDRAETVRGKIIEVLTGDSSQRVREINESIRALGPKTLALAFVDPPALQAPLSVLRELTGNINVDLLINCPIGMNMKRQYKHQLAAETQDSDLDAYYGGPSWRTLPGVAQGVRVGAAFLDHYKEKLRNELGYVYVGDTETVKHHGKNTALYVLILASRHPKGEEFWAKVTTQEPSGQRRLALDP
jgi:three-Cys-motif partner protein